MSSPNPEYLLISTSESCVKLHPECYSYSALFIKDSSGGTTFKLLKNKEDWKLIEKLPLRNCFILELTKPTQFKINNHQYISVKDMFTHSLDLQKKEVRINLRGIGLPKMPDRRCCSKCMNLVTVDTNPRCSCSKRLHLFTAILSYLDINAFDSSRKADSLEQLSDVDRYCFNATFNVNYKHTIERPTKKH